MRKILFLFAVSGIVLTMSNCDNPTTMTDDIINPFIGTWVHENGVTWIFTDTTIERRTFVGDPWMLEPTLLLICTLQ